MTALFNVSGVNQPRKQLGSQRRKRAATKSRNEDKRRTPATRFALRGLIATYSVAISFRLVCSVQLSHLRHFPQVSVCTVRPPVSLLTKVLCTAVWCALQSRGRRRWGTYPIDNQRSTSKQLFRGFPSLYLSLALLFPSSYVSTTKRRTPFTARGYYAIAIQ